MKTIVLIPSYNEEKSIASIVRSVLKNKHVSQCVVVDDASSDYTAQAARKAGALVLRRNDNLGTGKTVKFGLSRINRQHPDAVVLLDADGQHDPSAIPKLIAELQKGADYVIASRYIQPSQNVTTRLRKFGTQCISWWTSFWYGIRIYDATSGYRAMNKKVLNQLSLFYPTRFSEPEIILSLLEKNYVIKEISCQMRSRRFGHSSISAIRAMRLMIYIFIVVAWRGALRRFRLASMFL